MRQIIGIGHSHLHAHTAAVRELMAEDPGQIDYMPICLINTSYAPAFVAHGGKRVPNPAWFEPLRQRLTASDVTVFLALGGSEYWRWSLTPGPAPFDFVDPLQDDGQPLVGQLVPYDLFMQHARIPLRNAGRIVEAIRSIAPVRLVQILPPPPAIDLEAGVHTKSQRELVSGLISEYGVSPAPFRLKVWRACMRAATAAYKQLDVECLGAPPEALDPDGYLLPSMVGDALHGNVAWGRLQIERILSRTAQLTEAA